MKVIVCVKQVPDTSGKVAVNPDGTLNRASMATTLTPEQKTAQRSEGQHRLRSRCCDHGSPAGTGHAA